MADHFPLRGSSKARNISQVLYPKGGGPPPGAKSPSRWLRADFEPVDPTLFWGGLAQLSEFLVRRSKEATACDQKI
jgi:hypothetical protein